MSYVPSLKVRAAALLELRARERRAAMQFRGSANAIQGYRGHEFMLAGPAETGKTFATCWLLDTLMRTTPLAQGALLRKVAADIGPTVLNTYKRVVAITGSGAKPFGGEHPEWYEYPNGAKLYIGGMDRPGKILSGERDFIYANQAEELRLDDWETLTTRATGRGAVTETPLIFGDCNPGPGNHWIINRPVLQVFYSRHEDNPSLYSDDGALTKQGVRTMATLDALTGLRYKRLRLGLWVSAEGVVYELDRDRHIINAMPRGWETWRKIRVIDFGFTNPFSCQWWAIDPDGRMYLYREIYMTQRTVTKHVTLEHTGIRALSGGERYEATVTDHDAEDRATLEENGIKTMAAIKPITPGIEKVQERLKIAADGKPRIFFLASALVERDDDLVEARKPISTIEEFDTYVWPKGADGKPNKEVPVDLDNHGMDAMRYAVMYVDRVKVHTPPRKPTVSLRG